MTPESWIFDRRGPVAICTILISISLLAGLAFLSVDTNYRQYLDPEDPQIVQYDEIQKRFGGLEDNVLFLISSRSGESVFNRSVKEALVWATSHAKLLPHSINVDSIPTHLVVDAQGDDLIVDYFFPFAEGKGWSEAQQLEFAKADPGISGYLATTSFDTAAVHTSYNMAGTENRTERMLEISDDARNLKRQIEEKFPTVVVHLSGLVMLDRAMSDVLIHDFVTIAPLSGLLIAASLIIFLRNLWLSIAALYLSLFAVAIAFGVAGWIGVSLNSASIASINIIGTLAIADAVHLLSSYLGILNSGVQKAEALKKSLSLNFRAILITSVTTAIGFCALTFSESPPIQDLGIISAIGVLVAFLLTVGILPVVLLKIPIRIPATPTPNLASAASVHLARWSMTYSKQFLMLGGTVFILSQIFITKNVLNDDSLEWFSEQTEIRQAVERVDGALTGARTLTYSIDNSANVDVLESSFLKNLWEAEKGIRDIAEVQNVSSILTPISAVNRALHAGHEASYRPGDTREENAQFLLVYELSSPAGRGVDHFVSLDKSAVRLVVSVSRIRNREYIDLDHQIRGILTQKLPDAIVQTASVPLLFSQLGQRNLDGMLIGSCLALAIVCICLVVAFRSWRLGALSIIPNVVPILVVYGFWGLFVGELNIAAVTMFSISLGIIVDDTIHLITRYADLRRVNQWPAEKAIRSAIESVAPAITTTTIALGTGYLVLTMSQLQLTVVQSVMVSATVFSALIFDLFVLPGLLKWADPYVFRSLHRKEMPQ